VERDLLISYVESRTGQREPRYGLAGNWEEIW